MKKQHILGIVAGVLFIAAAVLIVRGLLVEPEPEVSQRELDIMKTPVLSPYDESKLPPRGNMTDEEYARHLMKLREEANPPQGDAGTARQARPD
jgi:hypothetical protein